MSIDVLQSTNIPAGTWSIDPSHSEVGFTARHLMSKVRGQFEKFEGRIVTGDAPSATATIDLNSINTREENRDAHLRSGDFFDVENNGPMTFTSTTIEQGGKGLLVTGDLSLKGVTKPVTLDVEFNGTATDPWGNEKAAFEAEGEINRTDWGLTWNANLEKGGVLVSEKIKLVLDVQLTKQA